MRILIAPDKFKGALSAEEAAECIARGIRETFPQADCDLIPIADGGEGTAKVLGRAWSASRRTAAAYNALGKRVVAEYGWVDGSKLAIFDMSEVAGLGGLSPDSFNLDHATTFGVGEMILAAIGAGAREIIIGLGGSMTNDGGFGMARALGWRFPDRTGQFLDTVSSLTRVAHADGRQVPFATLRGVRLVAAADVENPLLGEHGATRTFAAQKGASTEQIETLERAMTRFADVVEADLGLSCRNKTSAGAAGGLGFGLMAFCRAEIRSGFDLVAEATKLEKAMQRADVIITGEGRLDRQTLAGKGPGEVARRGKQSGKNVFAIVGKNDADAEASELFERIFPVAMKEHSDSENLKRAAVLLQEGAKAVGRYLADGAGKSGIPKERSPRRPT